jgi:hypothetical protein
MTVSENEENDSFDSLPSDLNGLSNSQLFRNAANDVVDNLSDGLSGMIISDNTAQQQPAERIDGML